MQDMVEQKQITCFSFMKVKPKHFMYALRGEGICLQTLEAKDFERPTETIKYLEKDEIVIRLFEHVDRADYYILAITNKAIYCFLDIQTRVFRQ
jgi:hypothetical protein